MPPLEDLPPETLKALDGAADEIVLKKIAALGLDDVVRPPGLAGAMKPPLRGPARQKSADFLTAWISGDVPQMKALSEGTASAGGYLVPEELRDEIVQRAKELSRMSKLVRRIGCRTNAIKIPTLSTDVAVSWGSEGVTFAESDPVFGQPSVSINRLNAITKVSRELLADSGVDLVDYLTDLFAEAVAVEEDRAIAIGSGSGQPAGLYSAAGLEAVAVNGAITYADLIDIFYTLPGRYRPRAVWLGHSDVFKAIRLLEDTGGGLIWGPSAEGGEPDRLMGRPLVQEDNFPSHTLMFGDPRYYHMYDRQQFSVEASTQGDAFMKHQLWLKAWERIDGKLVLAESWVKGYGIT